MAAPFPPFNTVCDWLTPDAVPGTYGVPLELVQTAMLSGQLTVRSVAGQTLVRHDEIKAMRLRLMAERGCHACED
ncbi:MAG: hypothetical protein LAT50_10445 [Ectothiorhodospiraceae bacterium]|nr:hypothetical protein [Ectothiorhodospiraceae bacterium]